MPHEVLQDVLVVTQEVIPGGGDAEVALHAQLVDHRQNGTVGAMGHQQDELVVTNIGGAGHDVMDQSHVGLIVQCNGGRHTHVHVGMTAVHGAGEHGGAGLLRHLLGQADGVEAVQAVGAVRAVLLNGAQGQDRYVTEIQGQRVQFLDRKADGDGQQGRQGGGRQTQRRHSADYEDLGPAFPSEASGLDDVPF